MGAEQRGKDGRLEADKKVVVTMLVVEVVVDGKGRMMGLRRRGLVPSSRVGS